MLTIYASAHALVAAPVACHGARPLGEIKPTTAWRRSSPLHMVEVKATKPSSQMVPKTSVAIDGGDPWSGVRSVTTDDCRAIAAEAFSTTIREPVLRQWFPRRAWLWKQWKCTILRVVLPREVLGSVVAALSLATLLSCPGPHAAAQQGVLGTMQGVERVWVLISGLVSFSLAFFLSQAYAMWRDVYVRTRQVQGRLQDLGLLCATSAERRPDGAYTDDAEQLLTTLARYVRVFNVLLYASLTRRFAALRTPAGLAVLVERQDLVAEEKDALLESSLLHNAVMAWISAAIGAALNDGRLDHVYSRTFQAKLLELRSTYASIGDQLSGRLPLAYTHLMQLLVDVLCVTAPLALLPYTSGAVWSTVLGAGLVTLFYSSVLNLAKVFLDPFDNDFNGVNTGISINTLTLLQETNVGSERWRRGAARLPTGVLCRPSHSVPLPPPPEAERARVAADVAFQLADTEGRGGIGKEELRTALRTLELEQSEAAIHTLFTRYDASGNGCIDAHEFRELVDELTRDQDGELVGAEGGAGADAGAVSSSMG